MERQKASIVYEADGLHTEEEILAQLDQFQMLLTGEKISPKLEKIMLESETKYSDGAGEGSSCSPPSSVAPSLAPPVGE
jgi:hypothetical protein